MLCWREASLGNRIPRSPEPSRRGRHSFRFKGEKYESAYSNPDCHIHMRVGDIANQCKSTQLSHLARGDLQLLEKNRRPLSRTQYSRLLRAFQVTFGLV